MGTRYQHSFYRSIYDSILKLSDRICEQTIVELLVAHNADVNSKTNAQNTPLHLAAIFGHAGAGARHATARLFALRRGTRRSDGIQQAKC
jgi:ankyrin repeat protein